MVLLVFTLSAKTKTGLRMTPRTSLVMSVTTDRTVRFLASTTPSGASDRTTSGVLSVT